MLTHEIYEIRVICINKNKSSIGEYPQLIIQSVYLEKPPKEINRSELDKILQNIDDPIIGIEDNSWYEF